MHKLIQSSILGLLSTFAVHAGPLDTVGVTLLRQVDPTLTGSGVRVAQAEASLSTATPPTFEVNPASIGQLESLFNYSSSSGTATTFPNSVGQESGHADGVANNFYGASAGVAPSVAHVDNYDADYFYQNFILPASASIPGRIVNQSFVFGTTPPSPPQTTIDLQYDSFAVRNNVLFVSGAGNDPGGSVNPPATCYNGIGVGVVDGPSSPGPTPDNGRCKPDLCAPGGATSFSTPFVSGAATILLQAGLRGDGGAGAITNDASDIRTLKALLLNGAIKPAGWTNGATTPLDARYGAGVVNVFNSWSQLTGQKRTFIEATSPSSGTSHPPGANTSNISTLTGWDFRSITNSTLNDKVNHYYFNLAATNVARYTATATLAWNRALAQNGINNLDLFLYDTSSGNLIASSVSAVNNVEHLYLPKLPSGRYDLQVRIPAGGVVGNTETYALAFEFFAHRLTISKTAGGLSLSWPIAPTGFSLQSATNLNPAINWSAVAATPSVSTGSNVVALPSDLPSQFFRLVRP